MTALICTSTRRIPTGFARRAKSLSPRQGSAWRRWRSPTMTPSLPWRWLDPRRCGGALSLIAGVELTCEQDGRELHILGHFIRDDDPALLEAMASLRVRSRPANRGHGCATANAWALDRSGRGPACLSPRQPGSAPSGRLPDADAPGGQYARGLRTLPRRRMPGLRGQTSA